MLEKHYGHTSNIASAAGLTEGGRFKGDKKVKAMYWLWAVKEAQVDSSIIEIAREFYFSYRESLGAIWDWNSQTLIDLKTKVNNKVIKPVIHRQI